MVSSNEVTFYFRKAEEVTDTQGCEQYKLRYFQLG